jgi:hypothetical protein
LPNIASPILIHYIGDHRLVSVNGSLLNVKDAAPFERTKPSVIEKVKKVCEKNKVPARAYIEAEENDQGMNKSQYRKFQQVILSIYYKT